MSMTTALVVASIGLLGVLWFAVTTPRQLPEALVAVPVAGAMVLYGVVSPASAGDELARLAPTVGFLAAILLLARLCDDEGVFRYAGDKMAAASHGDPKVLLGMVFGVASVVTATLSLDATVVLLTPVVFVTTARLRVRAAPHVFACGHLANSASLLLPVSNLTNLLAFATSGLSFLRFTALMAAPWLVAVAVDYVVHRRFFAADLRRPASPGDPSASTPQPTVALVVLGITLAGFVATSFADVPAVWPAAAGAGVLALRRLVLRRISVAAVIAGCSPAFAVFVLALAVTVRGVRDNGLADAVDAILPSQPDLPGLLLTAVIAAVVANVVNNLPAVLLLVPVAALGAGPGLVLAVLIGVNVGPNLTYVGSLANLLWRRVMRAHDADPPLGQYLALGLLTVPATLLLSTVALWGALQLYGP